MQKIIVASKNPVKIESVRQGFLEMFTDKSFEIEGVSVPSGVADQPMSDEETWKGAYNRAKNAQLAAPNADYWVGVEGGIIERGEEMETMAWVYVISNNKVGKARTAGFFLPPKVVELVRAGHELGHADDIVFGTSNSKQKMGASGLLTGGVMNRIRLYLPAVILALVPFKNEALY